MQLDLYFKRYFKFSAFLCIKLYRQKQKFGRMRNAFGTQAAGESFHSFFQFSQTFTMYFNLYLKYNRNMTVWIWKLQHNQTCYKTLPAVAVCRDFCTIIVNLTVQLTTCIANTLSHL